MRTALALVLIGASLSAAEPRLHRDLAYAGTENPRQRLDVYAVADGKNRPVVVWIHGGGWKAGDKARMQEKPRAFVEHGYVFVSINYRLMPEVTVKEMTGDVAKAIRWVREHAREYGGDPDAIVVAGHSAGAHLAALVCTDERYLKAEGVPLSAVKACIPVDTAMYDVPKRIEEGGPRGLEMAKSLFGATPEEHRDHSPAAHVAAGKHVPAFLILHVADRADSKAQSEQFAEALRSAGITAEVVAGEGKTHGTINMELGQPGDKPTEAVFAFLKRTMKR
jgi:arylformamidase